MNSNASFVRDTYDNVENATAAYMTLSKPVIKPKVFQNNIPWKQMRIDLDETFTYNENKQFRFKLPRSGLIDPKSIRLSFNCKARPDVSDTEISTTVSHKAAFSFDINSIFSKASLQVGRGRVLCEQPAYNWISRILSKLCTEPQTNLSQRAWMEGLGQCGAIGENAPGARLNYHAAAPLITKNLSMEVARRYVVPINLGIFMQARPLILDPFSEQLELEFTLDRGDIAPIHDQIPTTNIGKYYTEVGYPSLLFTYYPLENTSLYTPMLKQLSSPGFSYQYIQWDYNNFNITSKQQKQVFDIPIFKKYLRHAIAFITCTSDVGSQAYSSFRMYSTLDPTSTFGVGYNSSSTAKTERANTRNASIKQYQWIYNKNIRIPDEPIGVINTRMFQSYDTRDGTPIDIGAESNVNQHSSIRSVVSDPLVNNGEEAWYHLEQTFLADKSKKMSLSHVVTEGMFCSVHATTDVFGSFTNGEEGNVRLEKYYGSSGTTVGRVCSNLMMVGQFSQPLYDGTIGCLSGGTNNETLELEIQLNGVSTADSPPTMQLHVFVAYDNIVNVTDSGVEIDQ
jgi:hypothetical protein